MFSVKEFADGMIVGRYFGSVVPAIEVTVIVVTIAAAKQSGSSVELQTFAIAKLLKEGLTRKTAKKPTACDWPHFPLWIKVQRAGFLLSVSFRRQFLSRLPPTMAANRHKKPE
jgi:hypothetical protein